MNSEAAGKHPKLQPTERRMQSMLRRINLDFAGKLTFPEFAQLIRPYSIDAYIERIECNRTKERKQILDQEKYHSGAVPNREETF